MVKIVKVKDDMITIRSRCQIRTKIDITKWAIGSASNK